MKTVENTHWLKFKDVKDKRRKNELIIDYSLFLQDEKIIYFPQLNAIRLCIGNFNNKLLFHKIYHSYCQILYARSNITTKKSTYQKKKFDRKLWRRSNFINTALSLIKIVYLDLLIFDLQANSSFLATNWSRKV